MFLHDVLGPFVISQSSELRVPEMIDLRFILHLSIDCTAQRRKVNSSPRDLIAQSDDAVGILLG